MDLVAQVLVLDSHPGAAGSIPPTWLGLHGGDSSNGSLVVLELQFPPGPETGLLVVLGQYILNGPLRWWWRRRWNYPNELLVEVDLGGGGNGSNSTASGGAGTALVVAAVEVAMVPQSGKVLDGGPGIVIINKS